MPGEGVGSLHIRTTAAYIYCEFKYQHFLNVGSSEEIARRLYEKLPLLILTVGILDLLLFFFGS